LSFLLMHFHLHITSWNNKTNLFFFGLFFWARICFPQSTSPILAIPPPLKWNGCPFTLIVVQHILLSLSSQILCMFRFYILSELCWSDINVLYKPRDTNSTYTPGTCSQWSTIGDNKITIDERINLECTLLNSLIKKGVHVSNGINPRTSFKLYQVCKPKAPIWPANSQSNQLEHIRTH
jgi:hypothetical protein